jgi:hypothetical protein
LIGECTLEPSRHTKVASVSSGTPVQRRPKSFPRYPLRLDFLHPSDRAQLPLVSIMWTPYVRLREASTQQSIGVIQHPCPALHQSAPVCRKRAQLMPVAFFQFDFHCADLSLVRCRIHERSPRLGILLRHRSHRCECPIPLELPSFGMALTRTGHR